MAASSPRFCRRRHPPGSSWRSRRRSCSSRPAGTASSPLPSPPSARAPPICAASVGSIVRPAPSWARSACGWSSRRQGLAERMAATDASALWPAAAAFDIKSLEPRFLDDPYPLYRALREHYPIHRMPDGSYFLSRYNDCAAVYRDVATWSSDKKVDFRPNFADSLLYEHHTTSLVFNDPPYHTRVRKLLAPAFTPRALKALKPRVEALVDRLLDGLAAQRRFDLIDDFASAIPVQLIGDMLGVPYHERGPLRGWSLAILGALEPVLSPEQRQRGIAAVAEFKAYLGDLVERRLAEKAEDEGEILSTLIAASEFAR